MNNEELMMEELRGEELDMERAERINNETLLEEHERKMPEFQEKRNKFMVGVNEFIKKVFNKEEDYDCHASPEDGCNCPNCKAHANEA